MTFEFHSISDFLASDVESIFYFKDFLPEHSIERVVPTGHAFLLIELDGISRHTYQKGSLEQDQSFVKAWVSGCHNDFLSISAPQNSSMLVIQFHPLGAHPYLHFPLSEITDKVVPAFDLFGQSITDLRSVIIQTDQIAEKFALVEEWLAHRKNSSKIAPLELQKIFEKIQESPHAKFQEIISSYDKTQKNLIKQFQKYNGLTPKTLHRILRFNQILQKIQKEKSINWTEIAYQCGYFDQSHFIKEFKLYSGFNPEQYIKHNYHQNEPNFFPLD